LGYSSSSEPSASRTRGSDHPHIAEFDVDGLLALFVADIGLDRLLLVDDLLHAAVQEVVERSEVVFGEPFVREILT